MSKFKGIWLPNEPGKQSEFEDACQYITQVGLSTFKRNPVYASVVGNDVRNHSFTLSFFNYIHDHYPELLQDYVSKYSLNDAVGSPILYEINGTKVSAGTLCYMKVLGIVLEFMGCVKSIIEIGPGYGGQCLVFKQYDPTIDYTIVDISRALQVAKMYLSQNNIEHKSYSTEHIEVESNYDLCISDFCLTEMDKKGVQFYFDTILSKCKYLHITTNHLGISLQELKDILSPKFNLTILQETPRTTPYISNHIIIGSKK